MSSSIYGDSDFDVNLMLAVHIANRYKDDIKIGGIHENNQTVVDWVNNARKVIDEKG
jgi:hypothetical protein|tara:strand:- start:407 stop:577 length:171 start_codon:yes stop_codon:yes gene_type:complete